MTPLELKVRLLALEERVSSIETSVKKSEISTVEAMNEALRQLMDNALSSKPVDVEKIDRGAEKGRKLCPKCNKVPGYFFHVRSCNGP